MPYYKPHNPTAGLTQVAEGTAIFIDLDGTIMKFPFKRKILSYAIRELSEQTNTSPLKIKGMLMDKEYAREKSLSDRRYDWDDIVREVARELGTEWKHDLGKIAEESSISNSFIYPRTKRTLRGLRKSGYTLYAATNGLYRYQNPILEKLDLRKYFDYIIAPDKDGYYKNENEFFRPYMPKQGFSVMVGDEYGYDVYYPKKFGLKAVLLRRPQNYRWSLEGATPVGSDAEEPDAIIYDISELPRALKGILT
jgi:putative hydrolase of the HAD superfamily